MRMNAYLLRRSIKYSSHTNSILWIKYVFARGMLWLTVCPEALMYCGCSPKQKGQFTSTFCSNMMEVQVFPSVETQVDGNKNLWILLIFQQLFKYIRLASTCHFWVRCQDFVSLQKKNVIIAAFNRVDNPGWFLLLFDNDLKIDLSKKIRHLSFI